MEIFLEYPKSGYVKNIKHAVNNGNVIFVLVKAPKTQELIKMTINELNDSDESQKSIFAFFVRWFKLVNFLTGHFYAQAANYNCTYKQEGDLIVTYAKNI